MLEVKEVALTHSVLRAILAVLWLSFFPARNVVLIGTRDLAVGSKYIAGYLELWSDIHECIKICTSYRLRYLSMSRSTEPQPTQPSLKNNADPPMNYIDRDIGRYINIQIQSLSKQLSKSADKNNKFWSRLMNGLRPYTWHKGTSVLSQVGSNCTYTLQMAGFQIEDFTAWSTWSDDKLQRAVQAVSQ